MTNLTRGIWIVGTATTTVSVPLVLRSQGKTQTMGELMGKRGINRIPQENHEYYLRGKFLDYGQEIRGIFGDVNGEEDLATDENVARLAEWCKTQSGTSPGGVDYDTYERICSTGYRTIRGKLMSMGYPAASSDHDWKTIWLQNKHRPEFLGRINGANPGLTLTGTDGAEKAKDALRSYCEAMIDQPPSDSIYEQARNWCTQPDLDSVSDTLLFFSEFEPLKDDSRARVHGIWKDDSNFRSITKSDESDSQGYKLKAYCDVQFRKYLYDLGDYDRDIRDVYNYCNAKVTTATMADIVWKT